MNADYARSIREGFMTVSLSSSGGQIDFLKKSEFRLLDGVEGFGPAPVEYVSSSLPQGGGVRRHSRFTENEIHLPIELVGESPFHLASLRRRLESVIMADGADTEITVRVESDGEVRTQVAYLSGEGHSYTLGAGSSHFTWQKIGLTLTAPDPSWYGSQQSEVWALSPERMQILSELRGEPSTPRLVRTNYVLNPSVVGTFGRALFVGGDYQSVDSSASDEQPHFGSTSWRMEVTNTDGDIIGGRLDSGASRAMRYKAGLWMRPGEGVQAVHVEIQTDASGAWRTTRAQHYWSVSSQVWAQFTVEEDEVHTGNRRIVFSFRGSAFANVSSSIPVGSVSYVDGASLVEAQQPLDWFDGSSSVTGHTANWTGTPNESTSEVWTIPTGSDDILAIPFGYFRLSESTVQGATEVEISGDADAEAVIVVTGPGEDLEVINETTGQRIFIAGEIDEPITIDARPLVQDIYSESRQNGEWWKFVNDDAPLELITLRPGVNRVRVTMVNAHPDSKVELLYRETYHAGH